LRKKSKGYHKFVEFCNQTMFAGNGLFYPILGFASFVVFIYMSFGGLRFSLEEGKEMGFVMRNETQFVVDGKVFYVNGWNSYWLMDHSVDFSSRFKVREMMKIGAKMGLTVVELGLSMMVIIMLFKFHLVTLMNKFFRLWIM
jgi:hypothetical protein